MISIAGLLLTSFLVLSFLGTTTYVETPSKTDQTKELSQFSAKQA